LRKSERCTHGGHCAVSGLNASRWEQDKRGFTGVQSMYFRAEVSWKLFKMNGLNGITVLQAPNKGFFEAAGAEMRNSRFQSSCADFVLSKVRLEG
jgi:hypothetical protein